MEFVKVTKIEHKDKIYELPFDCDVGLYTEPGGSTGTIFVVSEENKEALIKSLEEVLSE